MIFENSICVCLLDKAAMTKIVTSPIFPTAVNAEKYHPINADWKWVTREMLTSKDGFALKNIVQCESFHYIRYWFQNVPSHQFISYRAIRIDHWRSTLEVTDEYPTEM